MADALPVAGPTPVADLPPPSPAPAASAPPAAPSTAAAPPSSAAAPPATYDLAGARAAGVPDSEIASVLAPLHGYNLEGARAAGVPDSQIADLLGSMPIAPTTQPSPSSNSGDQGEQSAALSSLPGRVGRAMIEGWKSTPDVLTPQARQWLANAEQNNPRPNLQDVLSVGHAALAAGNAVFQGGLEGIAALGEAAGMPLLGRDVAGYYEAMGMTGAPHVAGILRPIEGAAAAEPTEVPLPSAADRLGSATNVDQAISAAADMAGTQTGREQAALAAMKARANGTAAPPNAEDATEGEVPVPQSVGAAAAPPTIVGQTASQLAAGRQAMERRWLNAPRIAGFDDTQYVPDEHPLLFEIAGDPATSLEAKQLMQDPKYAGRFADALRQNNEARTSFLNQITGDATDVERLTAERDKQGAAERDAIWENKQPTDAQPVVDAIDGILNGPSSKVKVVRNLLSEVRDNLFDTDGNLESDPEILYGVRKDINTLLSKQASVQQPMNQHAAGELLSVRKVLDGAIEDGAPGFGQYLQNFAANSRPIEALETLQDKFNTVYTGADRSVNFGTFHSRLQQIVKARAMDGVNPAKSIPDPVMDALFALDASLGRATNIDLGKARGSDTVQNSRVGRLLGYTPEALAHVGAAIASGGNPMANVGVRMGASFVKGLQEARAARNRDALVAKHLDPGIDLHPPIVPGSAAMPVAQTVPVVGREAPLLQMMQAKPNAEGQPAAPEPVTPESAPVVPPAPKVVEQAETPALPPTVFTPAGREIGVRYQVVDARDLQTSQTDDLRANPAYPPELQPRDRTRASSAQQIQQIAANLQPERLGASTSAMEGAPIIGPDNAVESGNGRVLAIRRAYADNNPSAQRYRDWLQQNGFDVGDIKQPVLVRQRTTPLSPEDRVRFAQEANASPGLAMSAAERAQTDAQRMSDDLLQMWRPGEVDSAANRDFVRAFVKNIPEKGEEGGFLTSDGGLSLEGAQRIRNALLQRAYGDPNLVSALSEVGDENIKAFGGALMDAAGDMARLKADIAAGHVDPSMDISASLLDAARMVGQARQRRISLADIAGQSDMLSGNIDPMTTAVLHAAYGENLTGRMSRQKMAELLSYYVEEAGKQTTGPRLFGENAAPQDILSQGRARGKNSEAVRSKDLFGRRGGYGPGAGPSGSETQ